MESILNEFYKSINIAERMDKSKLRKIGEDLQHRYAEAEGERSDWLRDNERAIKLAGQQSAGARWAGEASFDVMYPIISTAAIHFAARSYPNIIKGADVVKCSKPGIGADVDDRAYRMAKFLNFQLINQIPGWPEQMDQLLYILPVVGAHFKKTYYGPMGVVSENVPAADLVIPYQSKSLEQAQIITQILVFSQNDVIERQRTGLWLDKLKPVDLGFTDDDKDEQVFLEHHCWIDLDEDGYKEPYVVVAHKDTGEVLRVTARFNLDGVKTNNSGEVYKIEPVNHYTRYLFMPAFDGGVYGMGFGRMLGPINQTVNAVINQLLDSGALYTRQAGFVGQDLRLGTNQSMFFKIGEWKRVRFRGDDLKKNLVPLPTHEPSQVLFQLLGMMVDAAKEMASVSELLSGEQRQANVPASTTHALIEQGLKVFSSIYKRIWRSLKSEVGKVRALNYIHLDPEEYANILNVEADPQEDFFIDDYDVIPVTDETEITEIQRIAKAESLLSLKGQGYNDLEIDRRYLEALGIEHIESILPEEKEPDPTTEAEVDLTIAKAERERAAAALDMEKVNSEVMEQNVSQAGARLDAEKLRIEKARAANDIKLAKAQTTAGAQRNLKEMNPSSKRRDQKQSYREVGMKSDNVRRKEQSD